jgi:hypothetical protein
VLTLFYSLLIRCFFSNPWNTSRHLSVSPAATVRWSQKNKENSRRFARIATGTDTDSATRPAIAARVPFWYDRDRPRQKAAPATPRFGSARGSICSATPVRNRLGSQRAFPPLHSLSFFCFLSALVINSVCDGFGTLIQLCIIVCLC